MQFENGRLSLTGHLTVDVASSVLAMGRDGLARGDLLVDFSLVESVDSTAVGVLLAWARSAQSVGRSVRVVALPDDLRSLSKLYGVEEMLPQAA